VKTGRSNIEDYFPEYARYTTEGEWEAGFEVQGNNRTLSWDVWFHHDGSHFWNHFCRCSQISFLDVLGRFLP